MWESGNNKLKSQLLNSKLPIPSCKIVCKNDLLKLQSNWVLYLFYIIYTKRVMNALGCWNLPKEFSFDIGTFNFYQSIKSESET